MTSSRLSRQTQPLAALVVVAAVVFIGVPAWQLVFPPAPFAWAVAQPFTWQGAIEALLLAVLVGAGLVLDRRWSLLALVALPLAFYLRRHAVDVPLLLDLVQLEIVVGLGALALRLCRLPPPGDARGYLHAFVCGFLVWSLVAWSASALDAGSIRTLRWLTLLLAIPAAFGGHAPIVLHLWRSRRSLAAADRFLAGGLVGWIATLFARTNSVYGYDSLWYGLRAEYVLDPGRSVYEPLGLVSPVHYFPKLYEMFLLPVAAMGDASVIDGVTILMLVLVLVACHVLARRIGLPPRARWPLLAVIAALPVLANSALSPKPDVISVLFVLIAADAALAFVETRGAGAAAWMLACCALACLAKLTALPYVAMLVPAAAVGAWRRRGTIEDAAQTARECRIASLALVATVLVTIFVTARTWLLAGLPTIGPDPLFRLWTALGFELAPPAGTLNWTQPQDWSDVPALVVDWLFRPQRLLHIVISWTGNVWLWCALLALLAAPLARGEVRRGPARWPLAALMATGAALAVGMRYHVRGSDGNYFLAAVLPAILVSATALFRRLASAPRVFAAALACLPAFALFHAGYSFVSAGWWPGTSVFDLDLARSWQDTRRLRWQKLQAAGLARIGEYLKQRPGLARAVGYAAEPASFWLPARFEHVATISFSRPEYAYDPQRFLGFLAEQSIDYLILPKAGAPDPVASMLKPSMDAVATTLQADPDVRRIDDRDYFLLDLSARHRRERASLR